MPKRGILDRIAKERNTTVECLLMDTYASKGTAKAVAAALGTTRQTIYHAVRAHGLVIQRGNKITKAVQS